MREGSYTIEAGSRNACRRIHANSGTRAAASGSANAPAPASQTQGESKRTFALKDGTWTECGCETASGSENVHDIAYLGDAYFALAADPEAARCLSLGERVVFSFGGKFCRVRP